MKTLTVGLLPLYLELYDRLLPSCRPRMEGFCDQIREALAARHVRVLKAPVCRLAPEVDAAVRTFEKDGVDALVTLHLAYSPSLESARVLSATPLPLILLDTTPTPAFGPDQDPGEIMYNHGIHGVQDLCNLLIRNGKNFRVEAGHWERSDVLDRVIRHLPAARMAMAMRTSRVGLVGKPFAGMGDFSVAPEVLREVLGLRVIPSDPDRLRTLVAQVSSKDIENEMAEDRKRFRCEGLNPASHERATRAGLAIRRWMADEALHAVTMNFEAAGEASGLPVMPFLEMSKAMSRGIGYAGEGDVLTAGLVGALASAVPATTFTEMFCPDWQGDRVFLSHMGEMNLDLSETQPVLVEPRMNFTPGEPSVVAYGRLRGGRALFVNIAPLSRGAFRLIVAPGALESVTGIDRFSETIRGWFKPDGTLRDFLENYSRNGGTHHAALVYGADAALMNDFAHFMGIEAVGMA